MSEQPVNTEVPATADTPAVDVKPAAVPDTSGPTVAELEAKIAELEAAQAKPADAAPAASEDEPEAAVFRADTSDTTAPTDPAPVADAAPAAPVADSSVAAVVAGSVGNVADSASAGDGVNADTARKVDEIHKIAVELSTFVSDLAPLFEDIQKNGLASLFGGMFGRR